VPLAPPSLVQSAGRDFRSIPAVQGAGAEALRRRRYKDGQLHPVDPAVTRAGRLGAFLGQRFAGAPVFQEWFHRRRSGGLR